MPSKTRIMVFGTFDLLHAGHLDFFRQARRLARRPYLIVSIARDENVIRIKGRKPHCRQEQRSAAIKKLGLADQVVLGAKKNYLGHILSHKPDVIGLGYDQQAYTEDLSQKLRNLGLKVQIVRLKPFRAHVYKSSLLKTRKKKIVL